MGADITTMNYFYMFKHIFWLLVVKITDLSKHARWLTDFFETFLSPGFSMFVVFCLYFVTQHWKKAKLCTDVRASHRSFK